MLARYQRIAGKESYLLAVLRGSGRNRAHQTEEKWFHKFKFLKKIAIAFPVCRIDSHDDNNQALTKGSITGIA